MNSSIKIQQATPLFAGDIQKIIVNASQDAYHRLGFSEAEFIERFRESLFPHAISHAAEAIGAATKDELYLVALVDDEVVGFGHIEKMAAHNVLHAVYVLPQFQRQAVGTTLWQALLKFADDKKPTIVSVFSVNAPAIEFYKNFGFVHSGKQAMKEIPKGTGKITAMEVEMVRPAGA